MGDEGDLPGGIITLTFAHHNGLVKERVNSI